MFTVSPFGKHGYYQINVLTELMTKFEIHLKTVNSLSSKTLTTVSSSCLWSIGEVMSLISTYTEFYLHCIILIIFSALSSTGSQLVDQASFIFLTATTSISCSLRLEFSCLISLGKKVIIWWYDPVVFEVNQLPYSKKIWRGFNLAQGKNEILGADLIWRSEKKY